MITLLAVVLTGIAVRLWIARREPADRLCRARCSAHPAGFPKVRPEAEAPTFFPATRMEGRRRPSRGEIAAALAVGLAAFLAVGGPPGAVVGAAGSGIALAVLRRREPPELREEHRRLTADLPLAVDLMVACLRAGQPITGAVDVTAEAIGGPLGERLAWVSGQLRLGAAPESAWQALASERSLAPLARAMSRAALSGAPVADVLTRLSDDFRRAVRAASSAAAQRVGVQVVAPLGLCFLPAFVFLGIIPVVAGLAGEVLLP
ncbi:type II secretion system F family protein [Streptosporangium amethystogenes]|uniref:type II secretion system F family protein n=1 Tax=Streptosporangium amethystogenes TaxID=2002 RepID=UPI000A05FDDB|nr:type II secretion system F family protein [Streptosporangium amethystogenes]